MPVAGIAAWYAAALTTFALDWIYWLFDYPCPEDQVISGSCPNTRFDWHSIYLEVLMHVGASIVAIYVVVGCTLMAPAHKKWIALIAYGLGAVTAGYFGRSFDLYGPMTAALAVGAIAAVVMNRKYTSAHVA